MTKMYEAEDHLLIRTGYAAPKKHCHMAAHIILSMGAEMKVFSEEEEFLCHGVVIPSGYPHAVQTGESAALVFLYDCSSCKARQIQKIQCITQKECEELIGRYTAWEEKGAAEEYYAFEKRVLHSFGIVGSSCTVRDERIASAMNYIRATAAKRVSCREAAKAVHLSQSRFSHLFKKEVGMTFAAYCIYQRLMYVYTEILKNKSITEAALEAGFSGSAHFADVNRRVFGISAGCITRDLTFRKV